jgi:hypothetical protein
MPGVSGVTVVTTLVCFVFIAYETAGAASARHSLRPLIRGSDASGKTRVKTRGEIADAYLDVIARSASDEAIHTCFAEPWIASRSLSSGAHSRDPLARNDG